MARWPERELAGSSGGSKTNPTARHMQYRPPGLRPPPQSEEAELLRAVTDQEILGLLIVIQHHLVGLATDARLLVAAERGMCRIGVIAVGPDPARLNGAAKPVAAVG